MLQKFSGLDELLCLFAVRIAVGYAVMAASCAVPIATTVTPADYDDE